MRLPVPPREEQDLIIREMDTFKRKSNSITEVLKSSIEFAKERRAALITAAVTGQIPLEEMS